MGNYTSSFFHASGLQSELFILNIKVDPYDLVLGRLPDMVRSKAPQLPCTQRKCTIAWKNLE
jgi:hypothetical protein